MGTAGAFYNLYLLTVQPIFSLLQEMPMPHAKVVKGGKKGTKKQVYFRVMSLLGAFSLEALWGSRNGLPFLRKFKVWLK